MIISTSLIPRNIIEFKIEATFSGVGCINDAWKYLGIVIEELPVDLNKIPVDITL